MDWVGTLARVLPWGMVASLLYALVRAHGRALLGQEELGERLARAEATLQEWTKELAALGRPTGTGPHAGHGLGAPQVPTGLPRGRPAPELALPDLEGRERTLRELLGRPLLAVFFSPRCGFSLQLAPHLGQLPEDGPRVLLISHGEPEEHRRLAREHGWTCDVVLQKDWEVSSAWQANGTPTGYLIDTQGRIASDLIIGADALLDLAENSGANLGRGRQ